MRTSFNNLISGDRLKNRTLKFIYLIISLLNFLLSIFFFLPFLIYFNKKIKNNKKANNNSLEILSKILKTEKSKFSDSRILCFDFLMNCIKKRFVNNDLNPSEIKILDIGCGTGRFYLIFKYLFNQLNIKISYLGIDIYEHENIKKLCINSDFKFILVDANEFINSSNYDFDIIFTQSVLEHMKYDLDLIKNISRNHKMNSTLQIHLVPSIVSLFSYVFHGYRHYSLFNIFILFKFFINKISLYPIGNIFNGYSHVLNRINNKTKIHFKHRRYLFNSKFAPIFYGIIINE
jgi:SAM-dependent methyltransferase